jgi:hypothetical protein
LERGELVVDTGRLLKRYTICKVMNHKWVKVEYPGSEGSGFFLKCQRCGKEHEMNVGPALMGPS